MTTDSAQLLVIYGIGVILLAIIGLYCVVATRNLIRAIIGLVLLTKSVTLLLIVAGNQIGQIGLVQALVITVIILEVVVLTIAVGIVLSLYRHNLSLDSALLRKLRG
jgi:multisubunit Na+/H+ antiporter MnhC subunit